MKNLLCATSLLIVFSCSSPQQKNTEIVEKNTDSTEVEITHNKGQSIRNVEAQVSFPKIEKEQPLDTIIHRLENGDTLFTYIYEYHDTIPDKPIRRFVTKNQNDSVIIKSFDEDFMHVGGTPESDYELLMTPYYIFEDEGIRIGLLKSYGYLGKNLIINFDNAFESLFSDTSSENSKIELLKISFQSKSRKPIFLQKFKEPNINKDSLNSLIELYNEVELLSPIYQERLTQNAFLLMVRDSLTIQKLDYISSLNFQLDDLLNAHNVLINKYLIKLFEFYKNSHH